MLDRAKQLETVPAGLLEKLRDLQGSSSDDAAGLSGQATKTNRCPSEEDGGSLCKDAQEI